MEREEVIRQIHELLDSSDTETVNTSMRVPRALREAAALAVKELGEASSLTALTTDILRSVLEGIVMDAALEEHFEQYPEARPTLAELAVAEAELTAHPLAAQPDLIRQAAEQIKRRHPDASPEDVLLWAEARSADAA
jgi:uncharacterized protein (UPF0147 family)